MENKLVSIITPCFNGADYLPSFINSIINQTYRPIELIFVDDGSCDNTKDILFSYKDKFEETNISLQYFYKQNGGQASAINIALPLFNGEYVMWMDSDDILLPHNVSKKVDFLDKNQNCGIVMCQGECVNENDINNSLGELIRVHNNNESRILLFDDLIKRKNVIFCPAAFMTTKSALYKSIPSLKIYENREGQNWQLLLPITYMFDMGYIDEILYKYVIHSNSHSHYNRSYQQLVSREENFKDILLETVKKIPVLSDDELTYWNNEIDAAISKEKLFISYNYNERINAKILVNHLKEIKKYNYKDAFIYFKAKQFYSKLIERIC